MFLNETAAEPHIMQLCTTLQTKISPQDLIIVHRNRSTITFSESSPNSTPSIGINRRLYVNASQKHAWEPALQQALHAETATANWHLSLYLSARLRPSGQTEIDIVVCNLDTRRTFNGRYTIWLVERISNPGCARSYWAVRQVVVRDNIFKLPQDETRGCPMPDSFVLPQKQSTGYYALVGAIFDNQGVVQAVVKENLPRH